MNEKLKSTIDAIKKRAKATQVTIVEVVKFATLTPEQKLEIAGEKGEKGDKGDRGNDAPTLDQVSEALRPHLPKGEKGEKGDRGPRGERGPDGTPADEHAIEDRVIPKVEERLFTRIWKAVGDVLGEREKDIFERLKKEMANILQKIPRQAGGGTYVHVADTPPDSPKVNDLWVDTS